MTYDNSNRLISKQKRILEARLQKLTEILKLYSEWKDFLANNSYTHIITNNKLKKCHWVKCFTNLEQTNPLNLNWNISYILKKITHNDYPYEYIFYIKESYLNIRGNMIVLCEYILKEKKYIEKLLKKKDYSSYNELYLEDQTTEVIKKYFLDLIIREININALGHYLLTPEADTTLERRKIEWSTSPKLYEWLLFVRIRWNVSDLDLADFFKDELIKKFGKNANVNYFEKGKDSQDIILDFYNKEDIQLKLLSISDIETEKLKKMLDEDNFSEYDPYFFGERVKKLFKEYLEANNYFYLPPK